VNLVVVQVAHKTYRTFLVALDLITTYFAHQVLS